MTNHDNYEDALFSLLMEDVCSEQGQEFIAECRELNELEEFENEEERLRRGRETISHELGKLRRQKSARVLMKSLRGLSIAAMLVIVLGAAAYLVIPQFRSSVNDYLIGDSPLPLGDIEGSGSTAVANNGGTYENYIEAEHTYDYTDDGIIETITYENPETGDSFSVKIFTEYPAPTSTVIEPPVITPPTYSGSSYGSNYSGTYNTPSYTYNGGMGYGRYSGYNPSTGAISIYPGNTNPAPGPTSALPNGTVSNPKPMIAGAGYGGTVGPGYP
ncbi:MAG: hypothetical protein Q4A83_08345 [Bacillota bacterium]|nr:hypothetical protein [Bacillota bacterium]